MNNLVNQCVAGVPCRSLIKRLLSSVPPCTTPPQEDNHFLDDDDEEGDDARVYETMTIVLTLLVVLLVIALVAVVKRTCHRAPPTPGVTPTPPEDDYLSCTSELAQVILNSVN